MKYDDTDLLIRVYLEMFFLLLFHNGTTLFTFTSEGVCHYNIAYCHKKHNLCAHKLFTFVEEFIRA